MKQQSFLPPPPPKPTPAPAVTKAARKLREARELAGEKASLAEAHANRMLANWSERADMHVTMYADKMHPLRFVIEDARAFAYAHGLEKPPEPRAWGAVTRRLQRNGVIVADGTLPAVSSRGSPKVAWRRNK